VKAPGKPYKDGEILVKFKKDVPQERIDEILKETGTGGIKFFQSIRFYLLRIPPGAEVDGMVEKFRTYREVERAEPNSSVSIQDTK